MSTESSSNQQTGTTAAKPHQGFRETVESLAVAVILALLFRGFVAEAFVIPTGSMAPTLMGAHKDLECPQCGYAYQAGASIENRSPQFLGRAPSAQDIRGAQRLVVATICPNCRSENGIDLESNKLHRTFNGDRILVSKFSYAMSKPKRWDVIVFKYPFNAKQYYIKRLVGLENETLRIHNGDIFTRPTGEESFTIARKPPARQLAMSHLVYDANYLPVALQKAGWPERWQPWTPGATQPPRDGWQIDTDSGQLTGTLQADDGEQTQWLRYFHRLPTIEQWQTAKRGGSLADVDPYNGGAVSDFYGYDSYTTVSGSTLGSVAYDPEAGSAQFDRDVTVGTSGIADLGTHWVGDLMAECLVNVSSDSGQLELDLVEAGTHYRCTIDVQTGMARLSIRRDDTLLPFDGENNTQPEATTDVTGRGEYHLRFANYDDQLRLWIGGDLVEFNSPTTYGDTRSPESIRPYHSPDDPLDAAPVAIGGRGIAMHVSDLKVLRDKYYIATRFNSAHSDYNGLQLRDLQVDAGAGDIGLDIQETRGVQELLTRPDLWAEFNIWKARRTVEFELEEGQYFPMGDNSPESLDARIWDADHYVEEDLLIGKALLIFWPHSWPQPVPFTPNFGRIGFIR